MSRVGKQPIPVPAGVNVSIKGSDIAIKGKGGELNYSFNPEMNVKQEGNEIIVTRPTDQRHHRALHGLTRALINNMVIGVSEGFTRILEIEGVGYRAEVTDKNLVLYVGHSHPIEIEPSATIVFDVPKDSRGRQIVVTGIDKQEVGEIAAYIRKQRPPEPYLGKGIRYKDEFIRRKEGKSGKASG